MGIKCASKTASSPNAVVPHLPSDHVPRGAKAGWWSKAVQLDHEAKGVIAREASRPLRWHRDPAWSADRRPFKETRHEYRRQSY
jgi:hypothetical protein